MCLAAIALDLSRRFPLVLAANRDEFFDRPAARLGWWTPEAQGPEILSGRDLAAGGTWLGLSPRGRLALLTNIRDPVRNDPKAPTRGSLVTRWLTGEQPPDRYWVHASLSGHNGFNLITADFSRGECHWMSNRHGYARRLDKGLFGLSNGHFDEPWPKVRRLKADLAAALEDPAEPGAEALAMRLLAALACREGAPDDELPSTGVPLALERELAPVFVRTADGRYGTRCSTVLVTERVGRTLVTHVWERTFAADSGMALMRRATLRDWPPRYEVQPVAVPVAAAAGSVNSPVSESSDTAPAPARAAAQPTGSAATRLVRPRVRSLIKPARVRSP
ncbi:uncharacterized protein with NRDE domain [Sphaerotilus hippei]|uniref:Uncharacterized protein with NRDE domain n=1 Tax=Sphaerotilus hippei TaxID=744406 RepID=A0A318H6D5_9BURK|nr:NRDE family protein [Sphaerotilus hippei]PXW98018.1 uncharacterized protein with NRDE domain [Sphaerotilus hippei]